MAAFRDDVMHDKESLNNGNQYTTDDQVSVEAFNYNIENGFYAAKTAKEAKRIAEEAKESAYSYDDTEIRNLISAEAKTRADADEELRKQIEGSDKYDDAEIRGLITAEAQAREEADSVLRGSIDSVSGTATQARTTAQAAQETAIEAKSIATDKYTKPSGGIPKSDLAGAIQDSLNRANSALLSIPSEYVTEDELGSYATEGYVNSKDTETLSSAKVYANTQVNALREELYGTNANDVIDTITEIANALDENQDVVDALNEAVSKKANQTSLDATNNNVSALTTRVGNIETKNTQQDTTISGLNTSLTTLSSKVATIEENEAIQEQRLDSLDANKVNTYFSINNKTLTGNSIYLNASDVGALPSTTKIPSKTSELTNDSGYLTSAPSNMATTNTAQTISGSKSFTTHQYFKGGVASSSTGNTSQIVMTKSDGTQQFAITSNDKTFIINPTTSSTTGQLVCNLGSMLYMSGADLGRSAGKWKDLYLSGGIYNNSGNKLTLPSSAGTLALTSQIPAAITVDSALSSTSTNPVQNKVVNAALNSKATIDTNGCVTATWFKTTGTSTITGAKSIYVDDGTGLLYKQTPADFLRGNDIATKEYVDTHAGSTTTFRRWTE